MILSYVQDISTNNIYIVISQARAVLEPEVVLASPLAIMLRRGGPG